MYNFYKQRMLILQKINQKMKSNSRINKQEQVQVVIRLKPLDSELKYQRCAYLASQDSNALVVQAQNKKEYFVFDMIANQEISQFQIYQSIGRQAVSQSLQGYNCCIFAYGQTGSGKTYSILGILQDIIDNIYAQTRGILPRLLQDLFRQVQLAQNQTTIRCSYMEIYNEQIYDLLSDNYRHLQINSNQKGRTQVQGLGLQKINTYEDAVNLLLKGEKTRKIASTKMNTQSSRSHAIFTVHIQSQIETQDTITIRKSKINIVDLAGSQRVKHTNVQGERLRQGCNINKSLHVLGNVINALVQSAKKPKHIPFRDSKLTYYLRDSLGGNSITKLLANIQCNRLYLGDTLSTLMFAKRAKILKNTVKINESKTQNYEVLRNEIKKLRQQLAQAKYINETRLSDRFQTENETQINFQKFDTSNFEYSNTDKPLQVFEQNELHYKALIQIYEEHMKQCNSFSNQNFDSNSGNKFAKKKNNNILSHSQWKKLQKKNSTLMGLMKRIPAFTKIYRQNQLLKQERNLQKNSKSLKKTLNNNQKTLASNDDKSSSLFNIKEYSYSQQKISSSQQQATTVQQHSTTLCLQQSQLSVLQQSFIPTIQQQQIIQKTIAQTVQLYEKLILDLTSQFEKSLEQLDKSYSQLEKQLEEKDKKIKQVSKRQLLPANLQQLVDENEYLKLNILQLQSQIDSLYKDLEQARIKHKQQGRRYSLFQQPLSLSNRKIKEREGDDQKFMSQSLNFTEIQKIKENQKHKVNHENHLKLESCPELQLNKEILLSLQEFQRTAFAQIQEYKQQKEKMLDCIQFLQKYSQKLLTQNKAYLLKNQDLKFHQKTIFQQLKNKHPQLLLQQPLLNQKHQNHKATHQLWKQLQKQKLSEENLSKYKQQKKLQMEELFKKVDQIQKVKKELNLFIMKQKATQKEFGKSINEILEQYSQIIQTNKHHHSIVLNSRQSGAGSHKLLANSKSSKFLGQYSGGFIKSTKQLQRNKDSNLEIESQKPQNKRANSKASSRASQEKNIFAYKSPKK